MATRVPKVSRSGCFACDPLIAAGSMKKRLVVCLDGTEDASDKGVESNPTNITRLCRSVANVGYDETGKQILQIVYYKSGIATGEMSKASSLTQAALGVGMDEKIAEAYTFIADNYGPGDEIFIFGFSRGAYTARSLAKMICQIGLLTSNMMDYFDEIYAVYNLRGNVSFAETPWAKSLAVTTKEDGLFGLSAGVLEKLKQDLGIEKPTNMDYLRRWVHSHVKIKVVGVYDTVGSVGLAGWNKQPGTDVAHYSSSLDPKIEHAFHAIALDEQRGNFPATMYWLSEECKKANVDLRQCWFPGFHNDVGGNSKVWQDTNSVDEIAFAWMIDQLDGLLQINSESLNYPILDRLNKVTTNGTNPLFCPKPSTPEEANERRVAWADGYFVETNDAFFKMASLTSSLGSYSTYTRTPGIYYASEGSRNVDYKSYNETIHPTVWHRMQTLPYKPPTLGDGTWSRQKLSNGQGFEWVKRASWGQQEIRLKEYVIPDLKPKNTSNANLWSGSLERRIVPKDVLQTLDAGNQALLQKMAAENIEYIH